jgi:WD40 repeat protein
VSIRAITFQKGNHLDEVVTLLSNAKEWIECMAYSPSEAYLGVGSHDNNIYLYKCGATDYTLYATLKGHSSFITSFDWSSDSEKIRSNSGAAELLFWDVKLKKENRSGASQTIGDTWATQSNKYGWSVNGIFPPSCDGSHINTVAQCNELGLIATGDDYGNINIYRDPVVDNLHKSRSFFGHSEHVTKIAFAN